MVNPEGTNGAADAPRTPAEIVAELVNHPKGLHDFLGYAPHKVIESSRNAELFAAWFEQLPADLNGVDLSPLYAIAGDNLQRQRLYRREVDWKPAAPFGDQYNGPIGEDGTPTRRNKTKWEEAKRAAEEAHANRFKADYKIMEDGDTPHLLHNAARMLMELAEAGADRNSDTSPWDWCQSADDVLSTAAAFRIIHRALGEIEPGVAAEIAAECAERLERQIRGVAQVTKKYE